MQISRATFGAAIILSIWVGMSIGGPWTLYFVESPAQLSRKVPNDGQTPKEHDGLPEQGPLGSVIFRAFLNDFAAARDNINALSTLTVAVFTYVLARKTAGLDKSTRRLWKASKDQRTDTLRIASRQARDMRSSIQAAQDAVYAAKRSTDAAVAVEAPKLVLSGIMMHLSYGTDGMASIRLGLKSPEANCKVKNYGRSPAFLMQSCCEIFLGWKLPAEPDYQSVIILPFNTVVDGGEIYTLDTARFETLGLSDQEVSDILDNKLPLWVYGIVTYRNFLNQFHVARFCKRLTPPQHMDNVYSWWDGDAPKAYTESS